MSQLELFDQVRQQKVCRIETGIGLALHVQGFGFLQPPVQSCGVKENR